MKKKRILVGLLLLATVALFLFDQTRKKDAPEAQNREAGEFPGRMETSIKNTARPTTNITGQSRSSLTDTALTGPLTNLHNDIVRKTAELITSPIAFWGKVVDQQGQPVSEVDVHMSVRDWSALLRAGDAQFRKHRVQTDTQGLFALTGEKGDSLSVVAIVKEGYTLYPGTKKTFAYSGTDQLYKPVAYEPFIFRLWRKGQPEPLIFKRAYSRLPSDGTPLIVDLVTGLSSTNSAFAGDIIVRMRRTPENIEKVRHYDWEVTVEAIAGGIQVATDAALYLAPETGYQPSVQLRVEAEHEKWVSSTNLTVFLHHRQGRLYSRVALKLDAHSRTGQNPFGFEAFINPAGSRNLEDDPRLRVEPRFESAASPGQSFAPSPSPVQPSPSNRSSTPVFPQPPPAFQALTNHGKAFPPPVQPRPQ